MTSIFSARGTRALRRLAERDGLLVFDLDGTLAALARRPSAAKLGASTRALLAAVARRYPTAVLTGRDGEDAARMLRGTRVREIVGNHGLDPGGPPAERVAAAWGRALRPLQQRGVLVETKRYTVTVHYRAATDRRAARRMIRTAVRSLTPAPRIVGGNASLNLLPDIDLDKGTALARLVRRYSARAVLYIGDDATDELAFAAGRRLHVVTIRVGAARKSAARYVLRRQRDIDALLARLLALRAPV